MKSIDILNSITRLDLWLVPWSVEKWMLFIPSSLLIFTENIMQISMQMKVNTMTTGWTNEYIFKKYFPLLTNYSYCQTSEDAHEYLVGLRKCLLEELQPPSEESNVTEKGFMYDEHLHSSMQKFWDLFHTGIFTQKVACTRCNNNYNWGTIRQTNVEISTITSWEWSGLHTRRTHQSS
jgi:hypothetical protein